MAKLKYPPNFIKKWLNKTRYKGRAGSNRPRFIVLHGTGGNEPGDLAVLRGQTGREVSAHLYITQKGVIHWLVGLTRIAWHAGKSKYKGFIDLNNDSIGIELENRSGEKWTEAQLDALDNVILWLDKRLGKKLPIVTHKAIAWPRGRKVDPVRFVELPDYQRHRDHDPGVKDEYTPY